MTLYHFCAARHAKKIERKGLCVGGICIPEATGFRLYEGWIWLTTDPDPKHQSWATRNIVPYSRTEYRCTVEIPEEYACRVWGSVGLSLKFPGIEQILDGWPGSENWRVFRGAIPRAWITKIEKVEG